MRPYVSRSCAPNGQATSATEFPASNSPPKCDPIGHTRQCTPMNAICQGRTQCFGLFEPAPPYVCTCPLCSNPPLLLSHGPTHLGIPLLYLTKTDCLFTRGSVSLHLSLLMCVQVSPTLLRFRLLPSFKVSQCNCMSGQQQHPFENQRERYESSNLRFSYTQIIQFLKISQDLIRFEHTFAISIIKPFS